MTRVLFKTGLVLFLITIISKLLGFTREILIARNYGTSSLADAYYVALTPTMLAITFSFTLSSVFLPLFVNFASDKKKSNIFTNNVLFLFFAIFIVAYAFVIVFTYHVIHILAPGLTEEAERMAVTLVRILFPLVFIVIAIQIYTLMLNTFHDYMASAASILPNNLMIIAYLWLFADKYGIVGVAVTTLVAYLLQLVIIYLLLKGHQYKVVRNVELWNSNSKKFLLLLYPIMISSGFNQWNSVVDRILASGISEGAIAALSYAFNLRGIATGICITPVITLTFPELSRLSHNEDYEKVSTLTHNSLFALFILLMPLTVIFMSFSHIIVQTLLERGSFDAQATAMTSAIFWAYSIGIIAIGFREVTLRAFYSFGDTKTPTFVMITGTLVNIVLSYILVKSMGVRGLGLSASISFILTAVITAILLKKKQASVWSKDFIRKMIKLTVAMGGCGLAIYFLKLVPLFGSLIAVNRYYAVLGLSVYTLLTYFIFIVLLLAMKEDDLILFMKKLIFRRKKEMKLG
ncbi:murein biosynthesis integral membrane protein MurJ [Paenibacillus qinlingensis]|uniref:murein biosynthesis integral membrane protein MurJ n=1 Tax=Paenibacillus qinlingensis TaxID=1837343 RepID=UPI001563A397|nr:murein biosynthesis integral membrane protein MurJ [Paenibacillus qinlingensis]NQX60421.1 murein biosynthesis integral membrane protein MurJ [Paenibacillus qinlingensis]